MAVLYIVGTSTKQTCSSHFCILPNQEIYRRVDKRFLWNEMLLQPLLSVDDTSLHSFLLPIIHGAVFIHKCIMRVKLCLKASWKYRVQSLFEYFDLNASLNSFSMLLFVDLVEAASRKWVG